MNIQKKEENKLFDFIPGALIEIELASQHVVYMNQIAKIIFKYSQEEIDAGLPVIDIFSTPEEFGKAMEIAKSFGLESYETGKAYRRLEQQDLYDFMLKRKTGEVFYGECQNSFVLDDKNVPTAIRMHVRDLTEQRIIEASLQASEEKYRTLVEGSTDLIFLFDLGARVISANEAAYSTLGNNIENMLGKHISEILPAGAAAACLKFIEDVIRTGESTNPELSIPNGDEFVWYSASINPLRGKDGEIGAILCVGRDITRQKLAKHEIEQALKEVEKANRVKDEFLSNMSHEVRTPLTSIIGFTDYLKKNLEDKLGPKDRESFDYIYQNSNRLLKIVNSILNFSKMQSGRFELNPKRINLDPFCRKLCDKLRPAAIKKGLELIYSSQATDDKVWLDEYSISEALENIIQNGIKYTDEGEIIVSLKQVKQHLVLTISDTGIGMSKEYLETVFQPFMQESQGFTREYQGVGLGLALSKRFLEWNEVKIEVSSKKGHGSKFTLTFPLLQST